MFGVKNDFAAAAFVVTSLFVEKASFSGFRLQPCPIAIARSVSWYLFDFERLCLIVDFEEQPIEGRSPCPEAENYRGSTIHEHHSRIVMDFDLIIT